MSLPLCEQCGVKPVKRRRVNGRTCRYCSLTCYGAALHALALTKRRPCKSCGEPASKARGFYCSKSCDMLDRRGKPSFERARRAGWMKSMETRREQAAKRLRVRLHDSLEPVFTAHPDWTEADKLALLKAALKVWRKAYFNGWHARDTRDRRTGAA